MEFKAYKLSYYLNAQHSFDDQKNNIHTHTFHICLYLEDLNKEDFIDYHTVDQAVNQFLNLYSGNYMNEIAPFDRLLPSIENIGEVFYEELKSELIKLEFDLIQLEISENPLRIYSVSDRIYLGSKK